MSSHNHYRWLTSRSHPSRSTGRCRIAVVPKLIGRDQNIGRSSERHRRFTGLAAVVRVACTFNVVIESNRGSEPRKKNFKLKIVIT
jgi:hypothetical protein